MATAEMNETKQENPEERAVTYMPMGSSEMMTLTVGYVKRFLAVPTRSGVLPNAGDIIKFMMLCKARGLDPWQGDAYLIGYDGEDSPVFNLITAVQALLKRAELCDEFDGIESGIVVERDGEIKERLGTIILKGETLVGGWARCYRKDRKVPFYQSVPIEVYDTGRSRWKKDRTGMIQKVAKSHVLREALPNHLGGLKTFDEMERVVEGEVTKPATTVNVVKSAGDLTEALKARNAAKQSKTVEAEVVEEPQPESVASNESGSLLDDIQSAMPHQIEGLEAEIQIGPYSIEEKAEYAKALQARKAVLKAEAKAAAKAAAG